MRSSSIFRGGGVLLMNIYEVDQHLLINGTVYPFSGCRAMALGSCMLSWITLVMRLPSRSDIAIELVPVSVKYRCE